MSVRGNPWGQAYVVETEDGQRLTFQGYDNVMNVSTPESTVGWDLAHVADDPQGEPDVILVAGQRFRLVSG